MLSPLNLLLEHLNNCTYGLTDIEVARERLEDEVAKNPNRKIRMAVIGTKSVNRIRPVTGVISYRLNMFTQRKDVVLCCGNLNTCDKIVQSYSKRAGCELYVTKVKDIDEWKKTASDLETVRLELIHKSDIVIFLSTDEDDRGLSEYINIAQLQGCLISKRRVIQC